LSRQGPAQAQRRAAPFFLFVVNALLGGRREAVEQELACGIECLSLDGGENLTDGGGVGEVVHLGEEVGGLLKRGELGVIVTLKRESRHG
jgi:hypothetical protein